MLKQLQLFAGVEQHGGQFRRVEAMMTELNQPDRAIALGIQVGCEFPQDFIRILILLVNQRREVALGVKHDRPLLPSAVFWQSRYMSPYITALGGRPQQAAHQPVQNQGWTPLAVTIYLYKYNEYLSGAR
jgi:hypothetical protein